MCGPCSAKITLSDIAESFYLFELNRVVVHAQEAFAPLLDSLRSVDDQLYSAFSSHLNNLYQVQPRRAQI